MISIAIIEDEYYVRQVLKKYIIAFGAPYAFCGEADNGKDGLQLILQKRPDIALVDITMPMMNGIQMIREAQHENTRTQMIILTGYSDFAYARTAVQLGVRDYLLKPLRKEDLLASLNRLRAKLPVERSAPEGLNVRELLASRLAELLLWGDTQGEEYPILMEHLAFPEAGGAFLAVNIRFLSEAGDSKAVQSLGRICQEVSAKHGYQSVGCAIGAKGYAAAMHAQDTPAEELLAEIGHTFHDEVPYPLKISAEYAASAAELGGAYVRAEQRNRLALFPEGDMVTVLTQDQPGSGAARPLEPSDRQSFIQALRDGKPETVKELTEELFARKLGGDSDANAINWVAMELMGAILEFAGNRPWMSDRVGAVMGDISGAFSLGHAERVRDCVTDLAIQAATDTSGAAHRGTVARVNRYIEDNYPNSSLRLDAIARENCISVQYLCSVYKRLTGDTVGDAIFKARMDAAKNLMIRGQRDISDIAAQCGYDDPAYFSKCFRKRFGVTPKQFIDDLAAE